MYRYKISYQSKGSQKGIFLSIGNFENYCMQQYGKLNIVSDMIESAEITVLGTLQK